MLVHVKMRMLHRTQHSVHLNKTDVKYPPGAVVLGTGLVPQSAAINTFLLNFTITSSTALCLIRSAAPLAHNKACSAVSVIGCPHSLHNTPILVIYKFSLSTIAAINCLLSIFPLPNEGLIVNHAFVQYHMVYILIIHTHNDCCQLFWMKISV